MTVVYVPDLLGSGHPVGFWCGFNQSSCRNVVKLNSVVQGQYEAGAFDYDEAPSMLPQAPPPCLGGSARVGERESEREGVGEGV